ncbi:hypothetical protein ACFQVC_09005 [Streptomyces monticola]|uniref:Lipoprotein n=1 Tax=Streptomyces monticola TaxID=2666263 RepID=A0ABW2JEA2_9ACTN
MNQTYRRKSARRILPLVPLLLTGTLLTACSGGSPQAADASGSGGAGGSDKSAAPTGPQERGLAFAECMRKNGVDKFPDPAEGGGIRITPGSGVDPQSPEFQKAQEACKEFSPQGEGGPNGGKPLDPAKVAAWAECIRENGMPEFPDPEINGGAMEIDMSGVGMKGDDPAFRKAMEACKDKRPTGGVMMKGGGGQ